MQELYTIIPAQRVDVTVYQGTHSGYFVQVWNNSDNARQIPNQWFDTFEQARVYADEVHGDIDAYVKVCDTLDRFWSTNAKLKALDRRDYALSWDEVR